MKFLIKRILLFILIFFGVFLVTSCHKTSNKIQLYTVHYQLDGGYFESTPTTEFDSEHIPTTMPVPLKDDHTFDGWLYNGIKINSFEQVIGLSNNLTLTASWAKNIVTPLNATISKEFISIGSDAIIYVDGHFDTSTVDLEYNENIISIDNWFNITGLNVGKTIITITDKADSAKQAILELEVINKMPILYSFSNRINVGNKLYFNIRNLDELVENSLEEFTFSINDESIATLNNDYSINGLKEGTITLTVTSKADERLTSSIIIDVVNPDEDVVLKTDNHERIFKAGDIFSVNILGLQSDLEFVWGSSDLEVLRILENGDIIAVTNGSASITVYEKGNPNNRTSHEFIVIENNNDVDYIGNLLSIAFSQNGYQEGPNNDNKYGEWYKNPREPWCAQFVSWCWFQAGLSNEILLKYQGCYTGQQWCIEKGIFHYKEEYRPKPGDIIFFDGHTGICAYVEGEYMYTIEGNASNRVGVWRWSLTHSRIIGYASPKYPEYSGTVKDFSFLAGKDEFGNYYWTNASGNQSTT